MVRLEGVLEEVLAAHDYPAPITHLIGEALVLVALMGGLLKGDQAQMTMQAQTNGGIVGTVLGGAAWPHHPHCPGVCARRRWTTRAASCWWRCSTQPTGRWTGRGTP